MPESTGNSGFFGRTFRTTMTEATKTLNEHIRRQDEWLKRIGQFRATEDGRLFNNEGEELLQFATQDELDQAMAKIGGAAYLARKDLITLVEQVNQASSPVRPPSLNLGGNAIGNRQLIVGTSRKVVFKVTPDVSENKSVSYIPITDIRSAGSIHIFIGSPGRTFGISAKFVSRTADEARENFKALHLLKGWTVPEKGYESRGADGARFDGDTPRIVNLYGYGQQIKGIPTVLTSLGITYPSDVDYIKFAINDGGEKSTTASIPTIMSLDIQLQEVRSADELTGDPNKSETAFNIKKYKNGELGGW